MFFIISVVRLSLRIFICEPVPHLLMGLPPPGGWSSCLVHWANHLGTSWNWAAGECTDLCGHRSGPRTAGRYPKCLVECYLTPGSMDEGVWPCLGKSEKGDITLETRSEIFLPRWAEWTWTFWQRVQVKCLTQEIQFILVILFQWRYGKIEASAMFLPTGGCWHLWWKTILLHLSRIGPLLSFEVGGV